MRLLAWLATRATRGAPGALRQPSSSLGASPLLSDCFNVPAYLPAHLGLQPRQATACCGVGHRPAFPPFLPGPDLACIDGL